jgi:hypothetical protein
MSTVLYAYRCPQDKLWDLHAQIRAYSLADSSPVKRFWYQMAKDHIQREEGLDYQGNAMKYLDKWSMAGEDSRDNEDIRMQVFYEPNATVLIRFLMNEDPHRYLDTMRSRGHELPLTPVFYDNRSDVPDDEQMNEIFADWVDDMIRDNQYAIIPILTVKDCHHLLWNDESRDPEKSLSLRDAIQRAYEERKKPPSAWLLNFMKSTREESLLHARADIDEIEAYYGEAVPSKISHIIAQAQAAIGQIQIILDKDYADARERGAAYETVHDIYTPIRALDMVKDLVKAEKALSAL